MLDAGVDEELLAPVAFGVPNECSPLEEEGEKIIFFDTEAAASASN